MSINMKVYFVGAGPGDPELMTLKAQRLLSTAQCCIYAGSLVSPEMMAHLPEDCQKYDSAKMSLDETHAVIKECEAKGIDVIRLHSGEPAIYGAISEQMNLLEAEGIEFEQVPGISCFQAAAAALKTELTAPEIAQTVILTRTSGRTPLPAEQELSKLGASKATLCIFLSTQKAREACNDLIPHYGEDCPAAVVYRASWPDQQIVRGTLADIGAKVEEAGFTKTALILVGPAIERRGGISKLYDKNFTHEYRKGVEK